MKICKIIVTALLDRNRGGNNIYPHHSQYHNVSSILEMLKITLELDKTYTPGVNMDTIIVNNDVGNNTANDELAELVKKYKGVRLINRPNNGGSFGAYLEIFHQTKNEYDYYIFTEDDILIGGKDNYALFLITSLIENHQSCFLGLVGIEKGNYPEHAHGGVGLVSTKILEETYIDNPFLYDGFDRRRSIEHEIQFTNNIKNKTGKELLYLGNNKWDFQNNFCINYAQYMNNDLH